MQIISLLKNWGAHGIRLQIAWCTDQSPEPSMVQDRLLPLLRASARKGGRPKIVNVASMAGRLRQLSRLRQVRQATPHTWNILEHEKLKHTKHVLGTDVGLSVICNYTMVYGILWQNFNESERNSILVVIWLTWETTLPMKVWWKSFPNHPNKISPKALKTTLTEV